MIPIISPFYHDFLVVPKFSCWIHNVFQGPRPPLKVDLAVPRPRIPHRKALRNPNLGRLGITSGTAKIMTSFCCCFPARCGNLPHIWSFLGGSIQTDSLQTGKWQFCSMIYRWTIVIFHSYACLLEGYCNVYHTFDHVWAVQSKLLVVKSLQCCIIPQQHCCLLNPTLWWLMAP